MENSFNFFDVLIVLFSFFNMFVGNFSFDQLLISDGCKKKIKYSFTSLIRCSTLH